HAAFLVELDRVGHAARRTEYAGRAAARIPAPDVACLIARCLDERDVREMDRVVGRLRGTLGEEAVAEQLLEFGAGRHDGRILREHQVRREDQERQRDHFTSLVSCRPASSTATIRSTSYSQPDHVPPLARWTA